MITISIISIMIIVPMIRWLLEMADAYEKKSKEEEDRKKLVSEIERAMRRKRW